MQICHTFLGLYPAQNTFNDLEWTTCIHKLFCVFHPYIYLAILHLLFQPITVQLIAFRKALCTNLEMFHATLPQIA